MTKNKTHCKRGHPRLPENLHTDGACKICRNEQQRIKYANGGDKAKEISRIWQRKHPENGRARKLNNLGWTPEMVEQTMIEQGQACALCRKPFTDTQPPCADHKHSNPPEPRGLLHSNCNTAIGLFKDDPELCNAAAGYLRAWGE